VEGGSSMPPEPKPTLTSVLSRLLGHLVTSRRNIMAEWQADREYLLKEIERRTAERDVSRQEVARLLDVETGHRIAIADLTSERDEARRECCTWQGMESGRSKQHVAVDRGWNYLTFHDPSALDRIWKLDEEMGLL